MQKNLGFLATIVAKPGKEKDVRDLLVGALGLAVEEPKTVTWYAFQSSPTTFHIFDTFPDEAARTTHIQGKIAAALMGKADELLAKAPDIQKVDVLASK